VVSSTYRSRALVEVGKGSDLTVKMMMGLAGDVVEEGEEVVVTIEGADVVEELELELKVEITWAEQRL
jgi:phosphotransferase system HPr-like phosphotransfer protein